jgi:hypothetical protein
MQNLHDALFSNEVSNEVSNEASLFMETRSSDVSYHTYVRV